MIVSSFLAILATAPVTETHCLSRHVSEAITSNKTRAVRYAVTSNGRSRSVSNGIIALERASLAVLPVLEIPAQAYQQNGVPLFCLDVVPMAGAPEYVDRIDPPLTDFEPVNGAKLAAELIAIKLRNETETFEGHLESALDELNKEPAFNCMTRHLLESILRSTRLVAVYRRMSLERGMAAPERLMSTYIVSQVSLLGMTSLIDRDAASLQAEGIPIICRDVPPIPTIIE